MRPVNLGRPNFDDPKIWKKWVDDCFAEIDRASQEDLSAVAADFTVTNYTPTRTINAGTASTADIANVLCTLIDDLRNRGMKRSQ